MTYTLQKSAASLMSKEVWKEELWRIVKVPHSGELHECTQWRRPQRFVE